MAKYNVHTTQTQTESSIHYIPLRVGDTRDETLGLGFSSASIQHKVVASQTRFEYFIFVIIWMECATALIIYLSPPVFWLAIILF